MLVGNNIDAEKAEACLTRGRPEREVAFGFQTTGGRRERGHAVSIHLKPAMTLGPLSGTLSDAFVRQLNQAFEGANYRLRWESDMDAWLKSHLAFILPICYVCYATEGVLMRATHAQLNEIADAAIEAHAMLKRLGYAIRPDGEEAFFTKDRKKCMAFLHLLARTPFGRLAASDHAMHAVEEMRALDEAFERLRIQAAEDMPVWEHLRASGSPQAMARRLAEG